MLKFIIIDDEPLAHEIIEEFCSMIPHIHLGHFSLLGRQYLTLDFMFIKTHGQGIHLNEIKNSNLELNILVVQRYAFNCFHDTLHAKSNKFTRIITTFFN